MNKAESNQPNLIRVGQRIKIAREQAGLSQEKFGEMVNKNQRTISNIERGTIRLFLDDLFLFASALNKPVTYFLVDELEGEELDTVLLSEISRLPSLESKKTILKVIQSFREFFSNT